MDARPAKHFARPPYRAEAVGGRLGWWGVLNVDGVNCLTFESTPGAVVTGETEAKYIAKVWNESIAIEDEDGGRVKVRAELGMVINPVQVVETRMIVCAS